MTTNLSSQLRGDPFDYSNALQGGWQASMFTGGVAFTLRTELPPTSQHDETDTYVPGPTNTGSFVDQGTVATGEITFSDSTNFRVFFPSSRTTDWPTRWLFWDLVGTVDADHSYTIDSGKILITSDVKRAP